MVKLIMVVLFHIFTVHASMGAFGDTFYEYLLKSWIQSGKRDADTRFMFDLTMLPLKNVMIQHSKDGLTYLTSVLCAGIMNTMEHLSCNAGKI
jgi:mannosyl-oligosaccharide alpha-1,2-mannosidase